MNRKEVIEERNSTILKIIFFLGILTFIGLIYLESHLLFDAAYFVLVLIFFIKFLIIKLYH